MASFNLDSLTTLPRTLSASEFGVVFRNGNIAAADSVALSVTGAAVVRNGGAISSISQPAIHATGIGFSLENTGAISGGTTAITIAAGTQDSRIGIISSGSIFTTAAGHAAIEIDGFGATLVNTGQIAALGGDGICFVNQSWSTHSNALFNGGHIFARGGETVAIRGSGATDNIENAGSISGGITTGRGADLLINSGQIAGEVRLGMGDDTYEGRTGEALGIVHGDLGNDTMRAGSMGEELHGDSGDDVLRGGAGEDTLVGGADNDHIFGSGGDDTIYGNDANDTLTGGSGDDAADGGKSTDVLRGGGGDDSLYGGSGADTLRGGLGDDELFGGDGNDLIVGGPGADSLTGGNLADTFLFSTGFGADHLLDFTNGVDQIKLSSYGLSNLADLRATYQVIDSTQGVRIDFGGGDVLVIDGLDEADLDNSDFIF